MVGIEAVNDRPRLRAGTAVGRLDRHAVAGPGLVVPGEGGIEVLVELAGRIVGDVEQRELGRRGSAEARGEGDEGDESLAGHGVLRNMKAVRRSWGRPLISRTN